MTHPFDPPQNQVVRCARCGDLMDLDTEQVGIGGTDEDHSGAVWLHLDCMIEGARRAEDLGLKMPGAPRSFTSDTGRTVEETSTGWGGDDPTAEGASAVHRKISDVKGDEI